MVHLKLWQRMIKKKKKFETVWSVRIQYAPPPCIAPLVEIAQMDSIVRDMIV